MFRVIQTDFDATGAQMDSDCVAEFDTEVEANAAVDIYYEPCRAEVIGIMHVVRWDNGSYSRFHVMAD
jgi:hypothetical protein